MSWPQQTTPAMTFDAAQMVGDQNSLKGDFNETKSDLKLTFRTSLGRFG
jgi:hypothetical protein